MTTGYQAAMLSQPRLRELAELIDRSRPPEPPADLRLYARKETAQPEGAERRRDRRYSLITKVIAVPVDKKLQTLGQPFVALSSGMSVSGIRLIHTCPAPARLLFLQIDGQPVQFVLTVVRSRPVGHRFEIAGRLVNASVASQVDRAPIDLPADANHIAADHIAADRAVGSSVLSLVRNENSLPSVDEICQWDAVTAALQILNAEQTSRQQALR